MQNTFISSKLILFVATVFGLLAALLLGNLVAEQDYFILVISFGGLGAMLFSLSMMQYALPLSLFFCFAAFILAPIGISMDILEQTALALGLIVFPRIWIKPTFNQYPYKQAFSYKIFVLFIWLFLIYLVLHSLLSRYLPYPGMLFSLKGLLRVYLQMFFPMLFIAFLTHYNYGLELPKKSTKFAVFCILMGLMFSVGIRVITAISTGFDSLYAESDELFDVKGKALPYLLYIPIINLHENVFGLRVAGPAAVLIGSLLCAMKTKYVATRYSVLIVLLGLLGASLSGGRAALLVSGFYLFVALAISSRRALLIPFLGVLSVMAAAIIFMPRELALQLPLTMQRSIAMYTPSLHGTEAHNMIQGSSRQRDKWFANALNAWQESPRAFWLGRSISTLGEVDIRSFMIGDERGRMEFGIKRGVTHNQITNLLVSFGLVGAILYYAVIISLIIFLIRMAGKIPDTYECKPWILAAAISSFMYLAYSSLGGTNYWPVNMCFALYGLLIYNREFKSRESRA